MRRLPSSRSLSPLEQHPSACAATRRRAVTVALVGFLLVACVLLAAGSSRGRRASSSDWARSQRGIVVERASSSTSSTSSTAKVDDNASKKKPAAAAKPSFCVRPGPDLPWPGAHHLVDDAYGPETAPFASCAVIPGRRRRGGSSGSGGVKPGSGALAVSNIAAKASSSSASSSSSSSLSSSSPPPRSCRDALRVPSVALLFLTRGPLPFEALWREWLLQARGMLPLYCVAAAACANGGWDEVRAVRAACGGGGGRGFGGNSSSSNNSNSNSFINDDTDHDIEYDIEDPHLILGQKLFRVYTHAPPSFPGYPRGSIFRGTLIEDRLSTTWGDHSMMEATRRLLQAALLSSASNQRFMLLSEACAPMYHPAVVHQQLLHERLSRIDACAADGSDGLPVAVTSRGERAGGGGGGEEFAAAGEEAEEEEGTRGGLPPPRPRGKPSKNLFWERWSWRFEEAGVTRGAWRKSAQWWTVRVDFFSFLKVRGAVSELKFRQKKLQNNFLFKLTLSFLKKQQHHQQLTREAATAVVRDTKVVAAFAEVCKFEQDADTVR